MKRLNVFVLLLSIGLFASCTASAVEEEIGLQDEIDIQSNCFEANQGDFTIGPIPPPPPCPPI